MASFSTRLADGVDRAAGHLVLALVPILLSLQETNKIRAVTTFEGGHVGIRSGLPVSVVTVWQFVSVPQSGVTVRTGISIDRLPFAVVTVPLLIVVGAALAAGYFGSIRNALDGRPYEFVANARRYFLPFLVLTVVPFALGLPFVLGVGAVGSSGGGLGAPTALLFVLAFVLFLVLAYLFYATPYLVVLREAGLLVAARQSYGFAAEGGPYLSYAVGYAVFVLLVSPLATGIVVNAPVVGLPLGIVVGAFLGLAANVATMRFVADLDPESSLAATWNDGGDDPADVASAT